jgi:MFS family permease
MLWLTKRTNRATVIGYYGLIWPVLAIFLPIAGGTVIVRMGMWTDVAIASIVLVVLVLFLYMYAELPAIGTFDVRAWKAMRELAPRLRWGILLNGIIDGTAGVATPLLGFQFARTALDYSIYLSAFSVAGTVAVFMLAYLSDRIQNRYVFLYLSVVFLFPTGIALALFYGPTGYLIAISLNSFGLPLLGTLLMALMGDLSEKNIENCVLAREVLLNLGRLTGAMCILAILVTGVGMSFVLLQITVVSVLVLLLRR